MPLQSWIFTLLLCIDLIFADSYVEVQSDAICPDAQILQDAGAAYGATEDCAALCDSLDSCTHYVYFHDDGCRVYTGCASFVVPGWISSVGSTVYERMFPTTAEPTMIAYTLIASTVLCPDSSLLADAGAAYGTTGDCASLCSSEEACTHYVFFLDGGCRTYTGCDSFVTTDWIASVGSNVMEKTYTTGTNEPTVTPDYIAVANFELCPDSNMIQDAGAAFGTAEDCGALCDSLGACTHFVYFWDGGCRIFNGCDVYETPGWVASVGSTVYERNNAVTAHPTLEGQTHKPTQTPGPTATPAYDEVSTNELCPDSNLLQDGGAAYGTTDDCAALCSTFDTCTHYVYFLDGGCRVFEGCEQLQTPDWLPSVGSIVYERQTTTAEPTTFAPTVTGQTHEPTTTLEPTATPDYIIIGTNVLCPDANIDDDLGAAHGTTEDCAAQCDLSSTCSHYIFFNDGGCRLYNGCSTWFIPGWVADVGSTVYEKYVTPDPTIAGQTGEPTAFEPYTEVATTVLCPDADLLQDGGAGHGDVEDCAALCDSDDRCTHYVYFYDGGCRTYSACASYETTSWIGSVGSSVYERNTPAPTTAQPTVAGYTHQPTYPVTPDPTEEETYSEVASTVLCPNQFLLRDGGAAFGDTNDCGALCDADDTCTHYVYFHDGGCRTYSSCPFYETTDWIADVGSTVYERLFITAEPTTPSPTEEGQTHEPTTTLEPTDTPQYTQIGTNVLCPDEEILRDLGAAYGSNGDCAAACDAAADCSHYIYFPDGGCRLYSSCSTWYIPGWVTDVGSAVYEKPVGETSEPTTTAEPTFGTSYEITETNLLCPDENMFFDAGAAFGTREDCGALCDTQPECTHYVYFLDGGCRTYNGCDRFITTNWIADVGSEIYAKTHLTPEPTELLTPEPTRTAAPTTPSPSDTPRPTRATTLTPTAAVVLDRCAHGDVQLVDGVAFVHDGSEFRSICGPYFWNNDAGASHVCQLLGYGAGTWSDTGLDDDNAFFVGNCEGNTERWPQCSFDLASCNGPMLRLTCDGRTNLNQASCLAGLTALDPAEGAALAIGDTANLYIHDNQYYDCSGACTGTCVGYGSADDSCDYLSMVCAGPLRLTFGSLADQGFLLQAALSEGNKAHSDCPPFSDPSACVLYTGTFSPENFGSDVYYCTYNDQIFMNGMQTCISTDVDADENLEDVWNAIFELSDCPNDQTFDENWKDQMYITNKLIDIVGANIDALEDPSGLSADATQLLQNEWSAFEQSVAATINSAIASVQGDDVLTSALQIALDNLGLS